MMLVLGAGAADARKVTGSVTCGDEKLSGVIVTDGRNFTTTKKNGRFAFEISDDAEFVYIVTPSGYVADWSTGVPEFYQPAQDCSKFDFRLSATGEKRDYNLLAIGDIQTKTDEDFAAFADDPVEDLIATARSLRGTVVGIALGDICHDRLELFQNYRQEIVRAGVPVYPVIGNHDHDRGASDDLNSSAVYRREMGPENYAFFMGDDLVIAVDNIIFNENGRYTEGYAAHVISWVGDLLKLIPQNTSLYIAQHSPVNRWYDGTAIENAEPFLDLVRGRKVIFLTGHSHIFNNIPMEEDIVEHNVAAVCGAWWDTYRCNDGTPKGYKVYTKSGNDLQWYYKSIGKPVGHQVELFMPGQAPIHPNCVVLNVWDADPQWKMEWYEDGKPMGKMEQVQDMSPDYIREINEAYKGREESLQSYKYALPCSHYYAACPSPYAKNVTVAVESRFGKKWVYNVDMSDYVDVQAHRGGMGLMPANTIEAMKHALDLGVNTLELDLQLSRDGKVVVSHDSYIMDGGSRKYLFNLDYEEIRRYDIGSSPDPAWPERKCIAAGIPLLEELIDSVEAYTREKGYSPVRYNIEIKTEHSNGEGVIRPIYHDFVDACARIFLSKHLDDRLVVQSFDHRALNFMNEKYPEFKLSYLVSVGSGDFDTFMSRLRFVPAWLSPHYSLVNEELVRKCREKGMRIVTWTVDAPQDMQRMIDLDVDAVITNYPDRLLRLTRGYAYPVPQRLP